MIKKLIIIYETEIPKDMNFSLFLLDLFIIGLFLVSAGAYKYINIVEKTAIYSRIILETFKIIHRYGKIIKSSIDAIKQDILVFA